MELTPILLGLTIGIIPSWALDLISGSIQQPGAFSNLELLKIHIAIFFFIIIGAFMLISGIALLFRNSLPLRFLYNKNTLANLNGQPH
jgi:hypothetical protein